MNSAQTRFSLFDELDRGLNHLVNEVLQPEKTGSDRPALSVYEWDDRFVIECDVPGIELDDITVQIDDGVMELSGTRKNSQSEETRTTVNERRFGDFRRRLTLSKDVDVTAVDAELGNGVLKITVPKSDRAVPKTVNIRSSAPTNESS